MMNKTEEITLDPRQKTPEVAKFERILRKRIIGQTEAVDRMVEAYQLIQAKISPKHRPLSIQLFLGPTGSGKTRTVEAACDLWFGDPSYFTKVNCGEFQNAHEIAKLIGSPPGYLGHRETPPLLTQETIERYQAGSDLFHVILFDEIEKANETLFQLLLGILDKAQCRLGDNRETKFHRSIIIMTSNLRTVEEARKRFSPEFFNRLDCVVVFKALTPAELLAILELELIAVHDRLCESGHSNIMLQISQEARQFLLEEGTDIRYGARHLKRAIEKHLVLPLANIIATKQIPENVYVKPIKVDVEPEEARRFTHDTLNFTMEVPEIIDVEEEAEVKPKRQRKAAAEA